MTNTEYWQHSMGWRPASTPTTLMRSWVSSRNSAVWNLPRGPEPHGSRYVGRDEVRRGLMTRFESTPDVHYGEIENFACGNTGMSKWLLTGTTSAGEKVSVRGCDFYMFEDGKVIRKELLLEDRYLRGCLSLGTATGDLCVRCPHHHRLDHGQQFGRGERGNAERVTEGQRRRHVPADHSTGQHAQLPTEAADKVPDLPTLRSFGTVQPRGAVRAGLRAGLAVSVAPAEGPLGESAEAFFSCSRSRPLET